MAGFQILFLVLFTSSACWSVPVFEDAPVDLVPGKVKDTEPSQAPTAAVVEMKIVEVETNKPTEEPATTSSVTQASTQSELKVEVMVAPTPAVSGALSLSERRCCRIGRKAARKGYSCYVDMAIVERRLNMPHRYKMKFSVHGPKYGYGFANKLKFCGKHRKRQRIFNHCCEKNAAVMDV